MSIIAGGDLLLPNKFAFGAAAYDAVGIIDGQRGRLAIVLGAAPDETEIDIKLITRLWPDPATEAGISYDPLLTGLAVAIAVFDLPSDVPAGVYPLSFRRYDGQGNEVPGAAPPSYGRTLEVLAADPGDEDFTPLRAFAPGWPQGKDVVASGDVEILYPWPRITLITLAGQQHGAIHFVLAYPNSLIAEIRNVYEESRTGQRSIIQWSDDNAAGELTIDLASPDPPQLYRLAVAFRPTNPSVAAVTPADLSVLDTRIYDLDGNLQPSAVINPLFVQ